MSPSYIQVRAVVWAYGRGQTDRHTDIQTHTHTHTQTRVTTIRFASSTTHAKCNNPIRVSTFIRTFQMKRLRKIVATRMWADAQRDGRPDEYRWRPLLNAAKFG